MVAECPSLAVADLNQEVPVAPWWARVPAGYLRFSPGHEGELSAAIPGGGRPPSCPARPLVEPISSLTRR